MLIVETSNKINAPSKAFTSTSSEFTGNADISNTKSGSEECLTEQRNTTSNTDVIIMELEANCVGEFAVSEEDNSNHLARTKFSEYLNSIENVPKNNLKAKAENFVFNNCNVTINYNK